MGKREKSMKCTGRNIFSILSCIFVTKTLGLETKEQMEASIEASQGVFEDWEYKLISLFEPKPLDLAFKYFLIQEAGSATATQFYDQLKMTNKLIRPDLVWYDDNVSWLKHLVSSNGTEQKFFLQEMIEKKDLTMLTVDRLPGIDQTFDCWVILAFDSSELQKSDLNLMDQILSQFNEKCQVGAIDLSFPSNRVAMRPVTTAGPSVIFRYPNSVMTDTKFHPQNWVTLSHQEVSYPWVMIYWIMWKILYIHECPKLKRFMQSIPQWTKIHEKH